MSKPKIIAAKQEIPISARLSVVMHLLNKEVENADPNLPTTMDTVVELGKYEKYTSTGFSVTRSLITASINGGVLEMSEQVKMAEISAEWFCKKFNLTNEDIAKILTEIQ